MAFTGLIFMKFKLSNSFDSTCTDFFFKSGENIYKIRKIYFK